MQLIRSNLCDFIYLCHLNMSKSRINHSTPCIQRKRKKSSQVKFTSLVHRLLESIFKSNRSQTKFKEISILIRSRWYFRVYLLLQACVQCVAWQRGSHIHPPKHPLSRRLRFDDPQELRLTRTHLTEHNNNNLNNNINRRIASELIHSSAISIANDTCPEVRLSCRWIELTAPLISNAPKAD